MALLTLGLNHNTAPVALREKLAFPTKEAIGTAATAQTTDISKQTTRSLGETRSFQTSIF